MENSVSPFVHLHNHSHYSLGDAISKISDIFTLATKNNMNAVALTDHGSMFGIAEFLLEAVKYPTVKPIVGCEIYLTPYDMKERTLKTSLPNYHHLILLAKNEEGYQNLSKMVSLSYKEGFYYRPRIDFKTLEKYAGGLIASSACLGGEIASLIIQGDINGAEKKAHYFNDLFGANNFFLEIMNHGIPDEITVAKELVGLSTKTGIPLIATNDVHYPNKVDATSHDVFLCISSGKKVTDTKRKKYFGDEFYFKSYNEMKETFKDFPLEALHNTQQVADLCNYKPVLGEFKLPVFETPNGKDDVTYLREMCYENLPTRYKETTPAITERLKYELGVVETMGFSSYFLIVQDFINFAKQSDIAVGPGRGSAAGSIIAYLLGITDLDPLAYNLLFERFLNPERISMPDIDTDFDDKRRDEVIQYVTRKYGEDCVAQIITFGRMKAKLVLRDVGRVLDIPLQEVDSLAKLVPNFTSLEKTFAEISDFAAKINENSQFEELYTHSLRLENLVRHSSIHAAGIIIGKGEIAKTVPVYKDNKTGIIATQYEGKYLEEFGLLKMDFLGLRNLRIVKDAKELILQNHKVNVDFTKISLNDPKTYKVFKEGKGVAIFQCESPGIKELMKKLSPSTFEDIIALIALYRPGPLESGMTENFVENKKNPKRVTYPHMDLQEILGDTYGVMVYQEQIMQISQQIAGFSLGEADNLRKAMGKKDIKKMASIEKSFTSGAINRNYDAAFATSLFNDMAKFAEYGFNKSHSAAYALISFQTAYLKAHYPLEYMCAVLNGENSSVDNLAKYLKECKDMGITILPPDVNKSELLFSVEKKAIRFGFSAVKNVGAAAIENLLKERVENGEFTSFSNFIARADISKKVIESLCIAGAIDGITPNRATILDPNNMEKIILFASIKRSDKNSGMENLFGESPDSKAQELILKNFPEMSREDLLHNEKEILGFYATGHPLEQWQEKIENATTHTTGDIKELKNNNITEDDNDLKEPLPKRITIAGRLLNEQIKMTKRNQKMAIYLLEDLESELPLIIFPQIYGSYEMMLQTKEPLVFTCTVDFTRSELQLIVEKIESIHSFVSSPNLIIKNEKNHFSKKKEVTVIQKPIFIELEETYISKESINTLKNLFHIHKGETPVMLRVNAQQISVGKDFFVEKNYALLEELEKCHFITSIKH